jgi:lactate dehydrogenase-like 2-hydroxyacid dehydrogenase
MDEPGGFAFVSSAVYVLSRASTDASHRLVGGLRLPRGAGTALLTWPLPTNALFSLDNLIITPHAAYYSEEAMRTVPEFAAHEVVLVLSGQRALSPVNVV